MWITCLLVSSVWEGSSSLMEARDGSLESESKTLSIRPHYVRTRHDLTLTVGVICFIVMINCTQYYAVHSPGSVEVMLECKLVQCDFACPTLVCAMYLWDVVISKTVRGVARGVGTVYFFSKDECHVTIYLSPP